jgi:hypothetical protein
MELRARIVLEDCRGALDDLDDKYKLQGSKWRRRWAATLALLRAVGNVLKNVDKKSDSKLSDAIQMKWKDQENSKPNPAIFWEFIKKERDQLLKEYTTHAGQGVTVRIGHPEGSVCSYRMQGGPFKGRDPRDVVREAIEWWDNYLKEIETMATS